MNRKIILVISILCIMGCVLTGCTKVNLNSDKYLAGKQESRSFSMHTNQEYTNDSMRFDFKKFSGKWSFFDLSVKKDTNIKIKDNSDITSGELYLVVLDNDYNIVAKKKIDGTGNLKVKCKDDEEYLIRIAGDKAGGHFDIKFSADNEYKLEYKEFFSSDD